MFSLSIRLILFISCFSLGMTSSAYAQALSANTAQGTVRDIINVKGYTYAEIDTGSEIFWTAGPTTALNRGDIVSFSTQMPMENFHSESMNRDFPLIYFISQFKLDTDIEASSTKPLPHPKTQQLKEYLKGVDKIDGGKNIAEIHLEKEALEGKPVHIRGQVTRFSADILGKNWLHIQDSSSLDDLTITTDNTAAVGDIVIIDGTLDLNKDFGHGYVFPLIVQNATVIKE